MQGVSQSVDTLFLLIALLQAHSGGQANGGDEGGLATEVLLEIFRVLERCIGPTLAPVSEWREEGG